MQGRRKAKARQRPNKPRLGACPERPRRLAAGGTISPPNVAHRRGPRRRDVRIMRGPLRSIPRPSAGPTPAGCGDVVSGAAPDGTLRWEVRQVRGAPSGEHVVRVWRWNGSRQRLAVYEMTAEAPAAPVAIGRRPPAFRYACHGRDGMKRVQRNLLTIVPGIVPSWHGDSVVRRINESLRSPAALLCRVRDRRVV